MNTAYTSIDSPCGPILIGATARGVSHIQFDDSAHEQGTCPGSNLEDKHASQCAEQLRHYFSGKLEEFDLELAPDGTPFQHKVWRALTRIGYAQTCSYGELATSIGRPTASRAVGAANGRNPIAIVIPCHRVIGSSGKLTGYAGGLTIKQQLLDLERGQLSL